MADINVTFTNKYGESRQFQIWDLGRDPSSPPEVFDGYLDKDETTDWIALHGEGSYGRVLVKRSDGPETTFDVTNENDYHLD